MTTTTAGPGTSVLAAFNAVLRRVHAGRPVSVTIRDGRGVDHRLDPAGWCRDRLPGDDALLARCLGATLDVGCGPGRLTSALNRLGSPALGIDVSAAAVRLARARGAAALLRDVFAALPGSGRWQHLLLADGNIGIGGDPHRLLARCRELLDRNGRIHVELAPPGTGSWSGQAILRVDEAVVGTPFGWAVLAADDLAAVAEASALEALNVWTEAGRWFATLTPV